MPSCVARAATERMASSAAAGIMAKTRGSLSRQRTGRRKIERGKRNGLGPYGGERWACGQTMRLCIVLRSIVSLFVIALAGSVPLPIWSRRIYLDSYILLISQS